MMKSVVFIIFLLTTIQAIAQDDDLLKELQSSEKKTKEFIPAIFSGTRLVNGQTVETKGKKELEFIFAHRFGKLNSGSYNLYGLDIAHVRIGLEYGVTDWLGVGIGRNSFDKTTDGFFRLKMLRQSKGPGSFPFTITAFGSTAYKASPRQQDVPYAIVASDRLAYTGQILIARKFTPWFSFQLMPTFIHKNAVFSKAVEAHDQYAIGAGTRTRISKRIALTAEYYYRLKVSAQNPNYDAIGLGMELEAGGHVFQLVLTNAANSFTERGFVTETADNFFKGGIHLGFNITRTFQLGNRK